MIGLMNKPVTPDLFPPIEPHDGGMLAVGGPHALYWEVSGNPRGVPVLFLHGGPGAGIAPAYRRFFDPRFWRIVLFDQRGAGRSRPTASLVDNTTGDLIEDVEALRRHLGVERWLVFGGSWGSTLALAYGERYPERCLGFVLRGVFLFRRAEVDWFLHGMGQFFPEAARRFREFLPERERGDLLGAYYARLAHSDVAVHGPAADAWCAYEEACSRLVWKADQGRDSNRPATLAMARLEAHYMVHGGFLRENELLDGLAPLHRHPVAIVQGRYDVVCPIATADELARAWPGATLTVVPDAGHAAMEPGIRSALVAAVKDFQWMLQGRSA